MKRDIVEGAWVQVCTGDYFCRIGALDAIVYLDSVIDTGYGRYPHWRWCCIRADSTWLHGPGPAYSWPSADEAMAHCIRCCCRLNKAWQDFHQ